MADKETLLLKYRGWVFDKVIAMGCDVIQGYYYAKAISLEEFKIFINTNTSIKYKSLVK